jgi:small subunit ribosomal protein S6
LLRDYEILYIVRPELDEEQLGKAVGTIETLIQNLGGEAQKTDVWGRRRLAYEVAHLREGQYVLTDFRLDPERVNEMETTIKISETVFRHLITRKPEKVARRAAAAAAAIAARTASDEAKAAAAAAETPAPPAPQAEETTAAVAPAEDVATPEAEESEA